MVVKGDLDRDDLLQDENLIPAPPRLRQDGQRAENHHDRQPRVYISQHGGQCRCSHKCHGQGRDPRVLRLPSVDQDTRPDRERDGRKKLIRVSEHRPDGADVPGPQEVPPGGHDQRRRYRVRRKPVSPFERLPEPPTEFLHHESRHARPGVDRREDEECLEHDGEMVPERHERLEPGERGEDLREPDGKGDRSSSASGHILAHLA